MADPLAPYSDAINAAAQDWGHDPDMLRALIMQESGADPAAVSGKGARGLTGIMPQTATRLGITNPSDPTQQIFGAAKYLAEGRDKEGSPEGALLYYHGGPDWRKQYGPESAGYVPAVAARYQALKDSAAPKPGGQSDADFLNATAPKDAGTAAQDGAATAKPESDADFLARTGGSDKTPPTDLAKSYGVNTDAPDLSPDPAIAASLGRIGSAASGAYGDTPPIFTPKMQEIVDQGPVGRFITNPLMHVLGAVPAGLNALGAATTQAVNEGATAAGVPTLARDLNPLLMSGQMVMGGAPGMPMTRSGLVARDAAVPVAPRFIGERTGEVTPMDTVAAPLPQAFRDNPLAQGAPQRIAAAPAGVTTPVPNALAGGVPTMTVRPDAATGETVPQSVGAAASREGTDPAIITELTPAQKATALQKMVNQSAEDRLTPQGRDDAVYFPGVERPEAMRDFRPAAEGEMSASLQHKVLYNTDSNYHDNFDAQIKKNNDVMLNGTTINGTRVDGLHDMFGDSNAREAAMQDARDLMPGSVGLFSGQKPVDVQPIATKIKEIMAGPAGKTDGVANIMRKMGPKLLDADGNPEVLPSQIKGLFDDINNKLFDKSPTTEGNEARQASDQLKQLKAVVSDVIGNGLPGTKWTDYLSNLSGALGQVSKLDYMQQFLAGTKKLTDGSGNLQLGKVDRMLEDIRKHSADQTGGARQMTMEEINKIEAARNELATKKLLDDRAGVRGSATVQLGNAAGILGSGPLGAAIRGGAEAALHAGLAATTGGVGNAALAGYRFIVKPAIEAAKANKAANALAATKSRLLDTRPNPLAGP